MVLVWWVGMVGWYGVLVMWVERARAKSHQPVAALSDPPPQPAAVGKMQ